VHTSEAEGSRAPLAAARTRRGATASLAWSSVILSLALAIGGLVLSLSAGAGPEVFYDVPWLAILISWVTVGALVASRQPQNPIGWMLCGLSLFAGVAALAEGVLERDLADDGGATGWGEAAAWFANWAWAPLVAIPLAFLPLYFPDGRLPSRRWRVVPWCAGVGIAAFVFSEAFAAGPLHDYEQIVNPYGIDHVAVEVASAGSFLFAGAVVAAVASVVIRYRRAEGVERQQIKWLAFAGSFAAASLIVGGFVGGLWSEDVANALILLGLIALPVAVGIAILRHGLYDIDLLIGRTLVYGGLTAAVVVVYVALVGGLSALFHRSAGFWLPLLATGVAALLVQPLRAELQRRVNRLLPSVGERGGASGLRGRLQEAFVPEAAELQRARERLVAAREEERRRLRRDLHDGLGPALAGAALKVEAAENLFHSDPRAAGKLLADARGEMQAAVADVRRLVYGLRPPALDELGLVGAIREQADRIGANGRLRVDVSAPPDLNGLPAAVEVAAYRIALEAMTNVARHADAATCTIRLAVGRELELEVVDDGRGLPEGHRAGVGIASMRERAEELGGSCNLAAAASGTRVLARLPLSPR
jgi:signal transduction histidine kinase